MKRSNRALVRVSFLSPVGKINFYSLVEILGLWTSSLLLFWRYKRIVTLKFKGADYDSFISTFNQLSENEELKSIDCLIMIHGVENKLIFYHPEKKKNKDFIPMDQIKKDLFKNTDSSKLNLLYSTACYGASHNEKFIESGFNYSIGSIAVNTNAATEFPLFLILWSFGVSAKRAIQISNPGYRIFDRIANLVKYKDTNSKKKMEGNPMTSISPID
ncbi:hypothetical protein GYB22_09750 [bacterium]|nr:hypothetical protein [bacterium]